MDAGDLRIFEAVARLGSMNRAAAELHTVQSNVTARIRLLEQQLQASLFQRHHRGVTLTPAGERLLPYAEQMRTLIAEAKRAVGEDGEPRGPLALGALETTLALRLAPLLPGFAQRCPEVDLSLHTGTSRELATEVLERRLEGAFICGPAAHPQLIEEKVYREELALLTPPGSGGLASLAREPAPRMLVLRAGCSYRQRLEEILARRGIVGLRLLEFGTLEALFGCVAGGLGITLLPKGLIGPVWRAGKVELHRLPAAEAQVDTVFIRRRDAQVSRAQTAFLGIVRASAARRQAAE